MAVASATPGEREASPTDPRERRAVKTRRVADDSPTPTPRREEFRSPMMLRAALLALWLCTAAPYAGSSPGGHLTGKVVSCNA